MTDERSDEDPGKPHAVGPADTEGEGEGPFYRIGDLARHFGVTLRTLRFYEDRGLVSPLRSGATRLYDEPQRRRVELALFGKRIGLSLGEVRTLLELHERQDDADGRPARERIATIYRRQLEALHERQREVTTAIDELTGLLDRLERN